MEERILDNMVAENEIVEVGKNELLDIFIEEEDRKGADLLKMSDFFDVFIGKIGADMKSETEWEVNLDIKGLLGQIAAAIKGGLIFQKWACLLLIVPISVKRLLMV